MSIRLETKCITEIDPFELRAGWGHIPVTIRMHLRLGIVYTCKKKKKPKKPQLLYFLDVKLQVGANTAWDRFIRAGVFILVYTGVRTGILGYFRKAHRKVPKFPEGKELLTNMSDTREIEYGLVPNTQGKSDLWKLFSLRQTAELMLMFLYVQQYNSIVKLAGGT